MSQQELGCYINRDVPCISCEYNLRGLNVRAVCPECGLIAEESLGKAALFTDGAARRSLVRIAMTFVGSCVALMIVVGISVLAMWQSGDALPAYLFLGVLSFLAGIIAIGAFFDFLSLIISSVPRTRRMLRQSPWWGLAGFVVLLVLAPTLLGTRGFSTVLAAAALFGFAELWCAAGLIGYAAARMKLPELEQVSKRWRSGFLAGALLILILVCSNAFVDKLFTIPSALWIPTTFRGLSLDPIDLAYTLFVVGGLCPAAELFAKFSRVSSREPSGK